MTLASRIDEIRARAEALLTDSCTIIPRTLVDNGAGGMIYTEGTPVTVNCLFMESKRILEDVSGGGVTVMREVSVMLAVGTEITTLDRIEHGDRVYEVVAIEDASLAALLKVTLKEIT